MTWPTNDSYYATLHSLQAGNLHHGVHSICRNGVLLYVNKNINEKIYIWNRNEFSSYDFKTWQLICYVRNLHYEKSTNIFIFFAPNSTAPLIPWLCYDGNNPWCDRRIAWSQRNWIFNNKTRYNTTDADFTVYTVYTKYSYHILI